MLRPSSLPHARTVAAAVLAAVLAVLAGVVGSGLVVATPSEAAGATPLDPEQPLVPRIHSITPDYVPDKGPIVIRGTVANDSDQTWTAINVHGFMGSSAITTSAALREAARTPVDADVGHRITVPGTFDSIPRLAPGQRASFEIKLPHSTLPVSQPGVYWFGVHVLGDNGEGGVRVAVGRDRTFLPYVPHGAAPTGQFEDAALVLPVRAGIERGANGAVVDPAQWTHSLRNGPLHAAVAIGRAAQDRPLTWLVDPAVPDVVRRLEHGNPPRTLTAPQTPGRGTGSPSPSPSPSPSQSPTGSGAASASSAVDTDTAGVRRAARHWLKALRPLLASDTSEVMGLPYGDLDLDGAARNDLALLRAAYQHTGHDLRPWDVPLSRIAAPPGGRTTGDTISHLPQDSAVLLDDSGVRGDAPVVNRVHGHRVILASSAAAQGGPGPVDPQSSLALRQRILAEAAVRLLDDQQPLVVELPTRQRHPLTRHFFAGLSVPWLRLTTLGGATVGHPSALDDTRLRDLPSGAHELSRGVYTAAQAILDDGTTLQSVLTGNHVLHKRLFREVAGNASYAAARTPIVALYRMRTIARWVRRNLGAIDLAAPPSVTLASSSGRFSALVSNDLDVPVTVEVRALSDPQLAITGGDTVQLPPHGRTTVLLNASTHQRGVHSVTLELTSSDGRRLGAVDSFPMRSEQVSGLIWVIIGTGVGLLFAAIVVRLARRIFRDRSARRTEA